LCAVRRPSAKDGATLAPTFRLLSSFDSSVMFAVIPGWGTLHVHALVDEDPTIYSATAGDTDISVQVSPSAAANVANERAVMERLMQARHQNVVDVLFVQPVPEHVIYGLVQIHHFHSIFDLVVTEGPLTARAVKSYVVQLCAALGHLHARQILHRNIKPENVLLVGNGQVKLTAFSSACPQLEAVTLCGTPEYMAPEVLLGKPYTRTCDWWSLGCTLTEMLTGATPFGAPEQSVPDLIRAILHEPIVMPVHAHLAMDEAAFAQALLTRDPLERLGAEGTNQVVRHAWLSEPDH